MPMVVGPDGTITIPVDADADPAAQEIAEKIGKAFAQALKDPKVAAAFQTIIKSIVKSFQGISKATDKEFRNVQKQGERAARGIAAAFRDVGKATAAAMKTPTTNPSLHALETSIHGIAVNMESLQDATREQIRLLELLNRGQVAATRARSQADRDAVLRSTQAARQQIVDSQAAQNAARNAALVQSASIRAVSREAIQRSRAMVRVFELTWKSAERFVRAFARGASSVLQAFGRTAASIFRGIARTIASSVRTMNNAWRGFGRAGISALQSLSRAIANALRRDEAATRSSLSRRERAFSQSLSRQQAAQQRFQQTQQRSLLGGAGLLGGVAAGGGLFGLLTSGFERRGQEELLELTFTTLLQDGDKAVAILEKISDFARTTPFDFVEVAGSVAQFTATLGNVDEAFDITTFLSDVVALTGGTTESLGRVRLAMTQIASAGRLDAANLKQLTESLPGVPFAQILADKFFGGDVAAYSEARDAGELGATITADAFFDAFAEGVEERFPEVEGFAQTAATTLSGLAQNLKENFAIFGAQVIGLVEGPLKTAMSRLNEFLSLAGGFISGEMFEGGGAGQNPFTALAERDRGATPGTFTTIPFEELPPEIQDILQERNGWGPNQGFVLAAQHAEQLWDELHPPDETIQQLEKVRDVLLDIGKAVLGVLAVALGFTLLKLALVGLTSPLGLLIFGTGLVAGAFSLMYDNSQPLREAVDGLKESLGNLGDTLGGFASRAGGNLSERLFGSPDLWGNLGDQLAKVVGFVDRIVQGIDNFLTGDLAEGSFMDKIHDAIFGEDDVARATDDVNPMEDIETQLFGDQAQQDSIATRILNVLEDTFIGPVIRFFRGPFADLVERIGGGVADFGNFLGDIFNAIFGGEGTTDTAGVGTGAQGGGIGTRIANVLEDTFLGPVVRFFRGPFADLAERIGGGVADFGGFLGKLFNAVFGGEGTTDTANVGTGAAGGGVGARVLAVLNDTFLEPVVSFFTSLGDTVSGLWERVEPIIQPLIDRFTELFDAFTTFDFSKLDLGPLLRNVAIGAAGGFLLGGVPGLALGGVAGAFFDPLVDSINNAWTMEIKPALDSLWDDITSWFADTFTAEAIQQAAITALSGIEAAGKAIGEFISDPLFVGIVTGTAAAIVTAIAAIILAFGKGLVEGVAANADEWGSIIGAGISQAMEWLTTEGPGVISGAILAMITDPGIGLALLGAGLLIGTGAGRSIATGMVTFFRNRTETGKLRKAVADGMKNAGLGTAVTTGLNQAPTPPTPITFFSKIRTSLTNGITRAKEGLKTIGKNIGIAIMGGLAAFETGNIAGRVSGGRGSFLLALLGGAGAGALAGSFLPGPGTIIGAGVGAALAGIGFAIGKTGREAEEAAAKVDLYSEAIRGLSGGELLQAGGATTIQALTTAFEGNLGALDVLQRSGFDPVAFFASFAETDTEGLQKVSDIIGDLANLPEVSPDTRAGIDALRTLMTAELTGGQGFLVLPDSLEQVNHELERLASPEVGAITEDTMNRIKDSIQAMTDAGIPLDQILQTLFNEGASGQTAIRLENIRQGLEGNIPVAETAADTIDSVAEAVEAVNTKLEAGDSAQKIADILSQSDLSAEERLAAVRDVAGEVEQKLQDARQAVIDFSTADIGPTDTGVRIAQFTVDVSRIGEEIAANLTSDEMNAELREAANTLALDEFTGILQEQLGAAIESGMSADPATFRAWQDTLIAQIRAVVEDPAVADQMVAAVNELTPPDADLLEQLSIAEMSQAKINEITGIVEAGISQAFAQVDLDAMNAVVVTGAGGGGQAGGGGGGFDLGGTGLGERYLADIITGITNKRGDFESAVETDIPAAGDTGMANAAGAIETTGGKYVESLAAGMLGAAGQAAGAARLIALIIVGTLNSLSSYLFNIGQNAGRALARGLNSQVAAAAQAAVAVAQAVISSARGALQISSPSKVFYDIGKQVGAGFIQGIKDAEGDMAEALGSGLEHAIEVARRRAAVAIERAEAGQGIFDLLQPSILPGGTTNVALQEQRRSLTEVVRGGFQEALRGITTDAFGAGDRSALFGQYRDLQLLYSDLRFGLADIVSEYDEAARHQAEINKYNAEVARVGAKQAQENLGARPGALTTRERTVLQQGRNTIASNTLLGAQRQDLIAGQLDQIREFGQTLLENGYSAAYVTQQMQKLTGSLRYSASRLGFSTAAFDQLANAAGLSASALARFRAEIVSLNQNTLAGAQNAQLLTEQFQAVRDYASELLGAGYTAAQVAAQVRTYRDQLVNQAVAFGFNRTQVNALVNSLGLSNSALANFIRQMQAFDAQAKAAAATAKKAAEEAARREAEEKRKEAEREAEQGRQDSREGNLPLPRIQELHVHVPSGDPEAVALVTANRLAYEDLTQW